MITTADIARAYNGKPAGDSKWRIRCPGHDDKTASAIISEVDGKTLIYCYAKCSQTAIFEALEAARLWPPDGHAPLNTGVRIIGEVPERTPMKRLVHTYDYLDADGALVHQTLRYEPKEFKQRRPNPARKGAWIWSLEGIETSLYNLPAIVHSTGPVWLVEGEKDADNLTALGLIATTVPMGAGKWRPHYAPFLTDRDVVLIPDNDEAGRLGMDLIASQLLGVASRIRMIELPGIGAKADISDWLAIDGNDHDRLISLLDTAEEIREMRSAPVAATAVAALEAWWPVDAPIRRSASNAWDIDLPASVLDAGDVLGALTRLVEPHTEADPNAIFISLLAAFGVTCGLAPHIEVGGTLHHARTHLLVIGRTAEGRKGESMGVVGTVFAKAIGDEWQDTVITGLSSGEGLVAAVSDETNPRNAEKRRLVYETEFARTLRVARREHNTLSTILRQAWDTTGLSVMTRAATRATDVHLSVLGHITPQELVAETEALDQTNGLLNRFLFAYSHRRALRPSCRLSMASIDTETDYLGRLIVDVRSVRRAVQRDAEADVLWHKIYAALNADEIQAIEARAAPMIARLSLMFALVNRQAHIQASHVRAACEVWWYSVQSARFVYGERSVTSGDATADAILDEMRDQASIEDGRPVFSQTDLHAMLGRNAPRGSMSRALRLLAEAGQLERVREPVDKQSRGRPSVHWRITDAGRETTTAVPSWLTIARSN